MTLGKPYDLVVFDLSGVLVRVEPSWQANHARAGVAGDPPDGPRFEEQRGELSERRQRGEIGAEEYCHLVAGVSQGVYTPNDVAAIHMAGLLGEYDGVGDVIDAVHAADVETAILTNTDAWLWHAQLFDEAEADRYAAVRRIRHRFASYQIGAIKPEHAVFEAVMEATTFEGRRILYFDDSARHIDAARDLGWAGVRINPSGDPARQMLFELNRRMVTLGRPAGE